MPGPLDGIRVIDLTAIVLGPLATMHLGDMGADVIKIEPPEGDVIRNPGNPKTPKMGPIFLAANRNKRSLCLDLKRPEAIAAVKRLVADADVFVHNNRPEAIERLGLGYDALKAINPRLVYAFGLGYKRSGPYGHKAAYDDLVQGAQRRGHAAVARRWRPAALPAEPHHRQDHRPASRHGHPCRARASRAHRRGPARRGADAGILRRLPPRSSICSAQPGCPRAVAAATTACLSEYRRPYRTKDGYVCALPYNEKQWAAFTTELGRPDLTTDPRFATLAARSNNQPAMQQIIAELIADPHHRGVAGLLREGRHPAYARQRPRRPVR